MDAMTFKLVLFDLDLPNGDKRLGWENYLLACLECVESLDFKRRLVQGPLVSSNDSYMG